MWVLAERQKCMLCRVAVAFVLACLLHVSAEPKADSGSFLDHSPSLPVETGSLSESEAHQFNWADRSIRFGDPSGYNSPSPLPPPPRLELLSWTARPRVFKWILEIWTQALLLASQVLYWLTHTTNLPPPSMLYASQIGLYTSTVMEED